MIIIYVYIYMFINNLLVHNFDNQMVLRLPSPNVLVKSFPASSGPPPPSQLLFSTWSRQPIWVKIPAAESSHVSTNPDPLYPATPPHEARDVRRFAPRENAGSRGSPRHPAPGNKADAEAPDDLGDGCISGWHLLSTSTQREKKGGGGCFSHEIHEMTAFCWQVPDKMN